MHLNIVPDESSVNSNKIVQSVVKDRWRVSRSIEVETQFLTSEAIVIGVVAVRNVPGSLHSIFINFTDHSRHRISASGIVDRLGIGKTETVVTLKHAVHEAILRFRLVAFTAHESARAVISAGTCALEVIATNAVHKTCSDFTHAVSGNAGNVSEGKSFNLIRHQFVNLVNAFLWWHVCLNNLP